MRNIILGLSALVFLAGCTVFSPRPDPTRFYLLSSLTAQTAQVQGEPRPDLSVGVALATIPPHLDRPQIVTQGPENTVVFADYERWAEPLGPAITRVVAENLAVLLGTDNVFVFPTSRAVPHRYDVYVSVLSLVGKPGEKVNMRARWKLVDTATRETVITREVVYSEPVERGYAAYVQGLNVMLERLSREIGDALRGQPAKGALPPGPDVAGQGMTVAPTTK